MAVSTDLAVTANDAIAGGFTYVGGADALACVGTDDGATSYVLFDASGVGSLTLDIADAPVSQAIESVTVSGKYLSPGPGATGTGREIVKVGGVRYYAASHALNDSSFSATWATNPATGQPWTNAEVNTLKVGFEWTPNNPAGSELQFRYLKGTVSRVKIPDQFDNARNIGSLNHLLRKRPEMFATVETTVDMALATPMLGVLTLTHVAGFHPSDEGWTDESWNVRHFANHGISIDPNTFKATMRLKDHRPIMCLVRDFAWSKLASTGALQDGVSRLLPMGATFRFARASSADFTNWAGATETAATDVPIYINGADGGLWIRTASGARAKDIASYSNALAARTWPASQGTAKCAVRLDSVSATYQVILSAYYNATNAFVVLWNGVANRWEFQHIRGGTTVTAYKTGSAPVANTWYQIAWRWVGSRGEFGMTPYRIDIMVDGVLGTSAIAAGVPTEVDTPPYGTEIGAYSQSYQLDGRIRKIFIHRQVMNDIEMARSV